MRYVLGLSGLYHDSAAALLGDGRILAAVQEERLSRRKNDARFPERAIRSCLEQAGITAGDLHAVAFYEKPLLKFSNLHNFGSHFCILLRLLLLHLVDV